MPGEILMDHAEGCGCPGCFGGSDAFDVYANVDGSGGTLSGKPVFTLDQIIANMNRTSYPGSGIPGPQWNYGEDFMGQNKSGDPDIIQFGFYTSRSQLFTTPYVYPNAAGTGLVGRAEYFGFAAFSTAQQDATRKSIALWDDLVKVTFVEVTDMTKADITYGNLTNTTSQAYAYLPYNYSGNSAGLQGDVWVNVNAASNLQLDNGFYGLATLIHETGHALGLQHPGAYNAAPGVSITYGPNAEYYQDTRQYSQMSYFNAENSGAGHIDWNRVSWVYGQTPLLHDIATIQAMYGADLTTRTGDTTYGFNSNAGRDVFDFTSNKLPVISIYDAGGTDTLDFSGFAGDTVLDLNPGAFSSAGGSGIVPLDVLKARGLLPASYTETQYLELRTRYNAVDGMLHDNISIAYGTIIENGIGSAGNDKIYGNAVGNVLSGLDGNDLIEGRAGNDTLMGGLGNDTLMGGLGMDMMKGGLGDDLIFVDNIGDVVIELLDEGVDTVSSSIDHTLADNVENLILTDGAISGNGNALNNTLTGNAASNRLNGGAGNDRLIGGDRTDFLTGGAGNDVFVAQMNANGLIAAKNGSKISLDVVMDFTLGDLIDLSGIDANSGLAGHQTFTWIDTDANKAAGQLSMKQYDSVQGAEKALGYDIDGFDGVSPYSGPVTVVLGNLDGGDPDFAMVLLNTPSISSSDFIFAS